MKTKLARPVPASASFMNTMPALFKFKLNFLQWLGYHKLIFNSELDPEEIEFLLPAQYQQVMRDIAKEFNIYLVDTHKEIASKYDEGFICWDRLNLTSYGNSLFAEIMLESLKKIIK